MKLLQKLGDNKMHLRKIKNSDNGVVGIIVAVLLVGLLVTFMSIIQVHYVPKWMKETESEHMNEVSNQFSQLKFAIDTQTALKEENVPMTSPVTLGSTELPFFMSMAAYGQLDIIGNACIITFDHNLGQTQYQLGIVKFSSINAYLGDQSFIYEVGAIITSQAEGNIFAVKPFFKTDTTSGFEITFKLINISSVGGKTTSQTSTDATAIQTEYSSNITEILSDVTSITFYWPDYPNSNAWDLFLESSLENAGLATVEATNNQVTVDFTGVLPSINLEKYEIQAQIGPGWIEK